MKSRVYDSRANIFFPQAMYFESLATLWIQNGALAVKILFCSLVIQSTINSPFSQILGGNVQTSVLHYKNKRSYFQT